ncbi:MAG: hypothetical protein HFJ04_05420 [Lachnospiraceae bacterium]|nr:hypothetical protein [Lachnospiraceae bacterium]
MDTNKFLAIETELEYIIDWTKKLAFPFLAAEKTKEKILLKEKQYIDKKMSA